jgi:hypothetical protein
MGIGQGCHLHRLIAYELQTREQGPLTGALLLYMAVKLLPGVLPPMSVHTLPLSGKRTKSSERRRPI